MGKDLPPSSVNNSGSERILMGLVRQSVTLCIQVR